MGDPERIDFCGFFVHSNRTSIYFKTLIVLQLEVEHQLWYDDDSIIVNYGYYPWNMFNVNCCTKLSGDYQWTT